MERLAPDRRGTTTLLVILWLGCATAIAQPDVPEPHTPPVAVITDTRTYDEERDAWFVDRLVSPSYSADLRASQLELAIREADEGGRTAAALLGRLYFMGASHPASLVARDLERAERYLKIALASGDLNSMYWLAELELLNRRPLEAAIWAQSYVNLRPQPEEDDKGAGYIPSLLARIGRAPGGSEIDEETLAEYVAGFVQTHGDKLRSEAAGPDHRGTGWSKFWFDIDRAECNVIELTRADSHLRETRRVAGALRFRADSPLPHSGVADFLLEIRPDGRVSDALLVASLPDVDYGLQTRSVAESMKFNEVPSDCQSRWAVAPISLIIPTARLR